MSSWKRNALSGVVLMATTLTVSERPSDEYVVLMKDATTATVRLRQAIEGGDFAAVGESATKLAAILAATEKFWVARGSEDAVKFAQAGMAASQELKTAARKKDSARMAAASAALNASCSGCHNVHRQRLPDGTYAIK